MLSSVRLVKFDGRGKLKIGIHGYAGVNKINLVSHTGGRTFNRLGNYLPGMATNLNVEQ